MKDSGVEWIGEIPEDWELIPAKRIFKIHKDIVGQREIDYLRLSLTMSGVIVREKTDDSGLQPDNFETYQILRPNQIVFKLIDLENLKTSRVGYSNYLGIVSPAYKVIDSFVQEIYNKYYYYWYLSMYYRNIFKILGDSGVRSSLNGNELLSLPIPLIDLNEQIKITDYLESSVSKINNLILNLNSEIDLLSKYKKTIITETVTKGLDRDIPMKDSGIEWIGEIPEHWQIKKLKYIADTISKGISPSYTEEKLVPVINQASFSQGYLNKDFKYCNDDTNIDAKLNYGDVLLATTGGGVLGKSFYFEEDEVYLASTDVAFIRTHNKTLSKFIYYIFSVNYDLFNGEFAKGSTNQTHLQMDLLSNMSLAIPNEDEIERIVAHLDDVIAKQNLIIRMKQAQIQILEEYKKSLIYEYVTGKKEVDRG